MHNPSYLVSTIHFFFVPLLTTKHVLYSIDVTCVAPILPKIGVSILDTVSDMDTAPMRILPVSPKFRLFKKRKKIAILLGYFSNTSPIHINPKTPLSTQNKKPDRNISPPRPLACFSSPHFSSLPLPPPPRCRRSPYLPHQLLPPRCCPFSGESGLLTAGVAGQRPRQR